MAKKKFKKGSPEAKVFMAKLRKMRGKKKISGEKESQAIHKYLKDRNQRLTHGYHTQPNIQEQASKSREKKYRSHIKKEYKKVKSYKEPKKAKLSAICGINTNSVLNSLYHKYGALQAELLQAQSKSIKRGLRSALKAVKAEIQKVKKLK